jgi:hypothetical protein
MSSSRGKQYFPTFTQARQLMVFACSFKQPYLALFAVHAAVLCIFSLWLVMYGSKLQFKIMSHPR